MNKTVIKTYYVTLLFLVLGMVTYTILTGSQQVANGQKIAALEKQKQHLIEQQQQFEAMAGQEVALGKINQYALAQGFTQLSSVALIPAASTHVASR